MRFNKFKNKYGDLVDDVEYLVMHGCQVSLANISSVKLMCRNDLTHTLGLAKLITIQNILSLKEVTRMDFMGIIHIVDGISYHLKFLGYFLLSR